VPMSSPQMMSMLGFFVVVIQLVPRRRLGVRRNTRVSAKARPHRLWILRRTAARHNWDRQEISARVAAQVERVKRQGADTCCNIANAIILWNGRMIARYVRPSRLWVRTRVVSVTRLELPG